MATHQLIEPEVGETWVFRTSYVSQLLVAIILQILERTIETEKKGNFFNKINFENACDVIHLSSF